MWCSNSFAAASVAAAALVAGSVAGSVAAVARPATAPGASAPAPARAARARLTEAEVARLPLAAQARLLDPLRRLAADLDAQGRARFAAGYAGVELDAPAGTVELFATNAATGRAIIRAARHADPREAWRAVAVRPARYSKARLAAAAGSVVADEADADVVAVSAPPDGSALDVTVTASRAPAAFAAAVPRAADLAASAGVAVRVSAGAAPVAKSWSGVKWSDQVPFIGGDTLTPDGHTYCTAGLPAVRRSDHKQVLITAGHCFVTGRRVYTAGGAPGAYGNGQTGAYVGTVGTRVQEWDAEELTGTANNADESDTSGFRALSSDAYSYVGDYVCQDGAASYFLGHPTPCGIKVTDGDIWFRIDGYWARGVEGIDENTGWGAHGGDSGGVVFAQQGGGTRQARGIVSSGGKDGTPDQRRVDWIEAPDIFAALGLELNPQT